MTTPKELKKYFSDMGRKGGKSKSKKKLDAAKKTIEKVNAKKKIKKA